MNDSQLEQLLERHYSPATPSPEFVERLRQASGQVYRETFASPWRRVPWWIWVGLLAAVAIVLVAFWRPWEMPSLLA